MQKHYENKKAKSEKKKSKKLDKLIQVLIDKGIIKEQELK